MGYKIHAAIWRDASGQFTGRALEGGESVAYDARPAGVLVQLKRHLSWLERDGNLADPVIETCEVRTHRVSVRAAYPGETISQPVNPPIEMRVFAVHARRADDVRYCILPTLGLTFAHGPDDPAEELVDDAVRAALARKTPRELSRFLPPEELFVQPVFVRRTKRRDPSIATPLEALPAVAEPLGLRTRRGRGVRAVGRELLVAQLAKRLARERTNLLLVGEPGTGKSAVLHDAIRQAARTKDDATLEARREERPDEPPRPQQFWRTTGQRLISGMKYLGQWEARCEKLIEELGETNGTLCADELLELVRVGGQDTSESVAAFFAPYLERGELRLVSEASAAQLDAIRRLLPGLVDQFEIVRVPEFEANEARAVLGEILRRAGRERRVECDAGLEDLTYRLFRRFQPYSAFPGRTVGFVRRLLGDAERREPRRIDVADVLERFRRETGLPDYLLRDEAPLRRDDVLADFRGAVLGQDEACDTAASVLLTLKAGLNDPRRPVGVLLFCGPTGVGKTELAKVLADRLFGGGGDRDRLVRLDMSEYAGYGAADRLLMAPDGEASEFVRRVRRQPFCVVLLDEIEKASPDVHDALLGLMDEGRLTDRFGRVTTFQSAVIVMTSNVGAERVSPIGWSDSAQPPFERVALRTFRPEFLNRIDSLVTFRPLAEATIERLARRELESLGRRDGLARADLRLEWSDAVVRLLAQRGSDPRYGARPLLRAVEQLVAAPLARWLVAHPTVRGVALRLDATDAELRIEPLGG